MALSVPAKTPREVIDKLHDATEKALQDPEMREKLAKLGVEPKLMSVDGFHKFFKDDLASRSARQRRPHRAGGLSSTTVVRRAAAYRETFVGILPVDSAIRLDVSQRLPPIACTCE